MAPAVALGPGLVEQRAEDVSGLEILLGLKKSVN